MTEALKQLSELGVAVWLDDLSRQRLRSGNLEALVRDRHVVGVTTNPTIFQKAIVGSDVYDDQMRDLALRGVDVGEAVRSLTATDVRDACDVLRPVYDATNGLDGRVSIEVDPRLAHETDRTIAEAKALWWLVDRPNLYIKIPATKAGLPAISAVLAEGISVNVTLIFSLDRYRAVLDAYLTGVEQALARGTVKGAEVANLTSVASFFVSRVDTEIDARLEKQGSPEAKELLGKAAIANAQLAYQVYEESLATPRWKALAAAGVRPQRPLWASTGVKDPAYDDTQYVVELAAPDTVNTMPEATLQAVADHGVVRGDTIRSSYASAQQVLGKLAQIGVDYDDVVEVLESEGVSKFEDSWNELLTSIAGELEKNGAKVSSDGSAKPAGKGPAAASLAGSAR